MAKVRGLPDIHALNAPPRNKLPLRGSHGPPLINSLSAALMIHLDEIGPKQASRIVGCRLDDLTSGLKQAAVMRAR